MEQKKNPKVDPSRNMHLHFLVGLMLILSLTYVFIELKQYEVKEDVEIKFTDNDDILEEETEIFELPKPKLPPPPPPVTPEVIEVVKDDEIIEEPEIKPTEVVEDEPTEIVDSDDIGEVGDDIGEVDEDVPFAIIEQIPLFPGCEKVSKDKQMECFNKKMEKFIRRNQRYPDRAVEDNVQGRVSVQFVIGKDGVVNDVKVRARGKASKEGLKLLEDEAKRVISKLPKFSPGKQRGKAVNVKYALPIVFRLKN